MRWPDACRGPASFIAGWGLVLALGAAVLGCDRTATEEATTSETEQAAPRNTPVEPQSSLGGVISTALDTRQGAQLVLVAEEGRERQAQKPESQPDAQPRLQRGSEAGTSKAASKEGVSQKSTDSPRQTSKQDSAVSGSSPRSSSAYGGSTAGTAVEDNLLATQVKAALLADQDVRDGGIEVQVRQGAVTLRGNIESEQQAEAAIQVARKVEGVREVESQLQVGKNSGT
ncbi:MAG TPA: BON domain-containing protein [Noviherbaspirillum sp.]